LILVIHPNKRFLLVLHPNKQRSPGRTMPTTTREECLLPL
jgi:hypothetical protein